MRADRPVTTAGVAYPDWIAECVEAEGSPLAGRISHPLDDQRSCMKSSQPSIPLRPPGPGRTGVTIRSAEG